MTDLLSLAAHLRIAATFAELEPPRNDDATTMREAAVAVENLHATIDVLQQTRDELLRARSALACPRPLVMGEHACANRKQCWEPCGDLGKLEEYATPAAIIEHPRSALADVGGYWVPWIPGDLPPAYLGVNDRAIVTVHGRGYRGPFVSWTTADKFEEDDVLAFWSQPIPTPYTAIDLARGAT